MRNPIKVGEARDVNVNMGYGEDVVVRYSCTHPAFASVSPSGVVTPLADVTDVQRIYIKAIDLKGVTRAVIPFDIVPSYMDLEGVLDKNGNVIGVSTRIGPLSPVSNFPPEPEFSGYAGQLFLSPELTSSPDQFGVSAYNVMPGTVKLPGTNSPVPLGGFTIEVPEIYVQHYYNNIDNAQALFGNLPNGKYTAFIRPVGEVPDPDNLSVTKSVIGPVIDLKETEITESSFDRNKINQVAITAINATTLKVEWNSDMTDRSYQVQIDDVIINPNELTYAFMNIHSEPFLAKPGKKHMHVFYAVQNLTPESLLRVIDSGVGMDISPYGSESRVVLGEVPEPLIANTVVQFDQTTNKLTVSWSTTKDMDYKTFRVKVANSSGGLLINEAVTISGTSHSFTTEMPLVQGASYKVSVVDLFTMEEPVAIFSY